MFRDTTPRIENQKEHQMEHEIEFVLDQGYFLGVPIIWTIESWDLYWGPPILGNVILLS